MAQGGILVIRGGAIGDFIVTMPVLAALRARFPQARLEVLGYRHIAHLALAGGMVDDVQPIDARALAGFFAHRGILDLELRKYFGRFDIVLSYLYDPEGVFEANVRQCFSGQFLAGPHRPEDSALLHATEAMLKPLERLAIFDADPIPRLRLSGASPPGPLTVAFHPGSGSERKNWPEQKWAELLDAVLESSASNVLLVGGEAEGGRLERMGRGRSAARVELVWQRPLPELGARLTACTAFVGHDSGISHLAAALGLRVLALWGDTPERVWRPRGDQVRLVHNPSSLAALEVATVLRELQSLLQHP